MLVSKGLFKNTLLHGRVLRSGASPGALAGFDKPGREPALAPWERRQRRSQRWRRKGGEGFEEPGSRHSQKIQHFLETAFFP